MDHMYSQGTNRSLLYCKANGLIPGLSTPWVYFMITSSLGADFLTTTEGSII